jgi:16S rRNA processing protein RimM
VPELIRVGVITGAHGLKGALKFRPGDPDSTALDAIARVYLEAAGETREYQLLSAEHVSRSHLRIVLDGVNDIARAQALKGAIVLVAASDLAPLKPGEFYHFQAIGIEVRLLDGRPLGKIEEILATGANDVWVVRGGGREVLIPAIEDVVKSIDFDARVATIDPIPGLLDE